MAKLTPARITYFIGESEQDIRFHSVISEGHQATSEVTKYPVQSGFQISNHSIRQNRKISIEAIISNTLMQGGKTSYQYSVSDNSKTIFNALRDLVNLKTKTKVLTNLGVYDPVVFTSFKTKQMAGMVDSMKVILVGEELQVADAINGTAPTPVSWTLLSAAKAEARKDDLAAAGVIICEGASFEEAVVELGKDFSIENLTSTGRAISTTYENLGADLTTGMYEYIVHTTDTDLYQAVGDLVGQTPTEISSKVAAGVSGVSGCVVEGTVTIAVDEIIDTIDTAMGELKRSGFGVLYETMLMSSDEVGQDLIGMTSGCVVRGITGYVDQFPFQPGESLPSAIDILNGAINFGAAKSNPNKSVTGGAPTTSTILTRITCPTEEG